MKNILLIIFFVFVLFACEEQSLHYRETKIYEFLVENQLADKTVIIVPKSKTDFWITSNESYIYIVVPRDIIVIGSKIVYDNNKKATDIYNFDDIIEPFEIYIDGIKQDKPFPLREFWEFSIGTLNESGQYTLIINENILED